jgi:SAM-dependent methyltransferase
MPFQMLKKIDHELKEYYGKNLGLNGAGAKGVGWKNEEAQFVRFAQLARLITDSPFTINDLGCGVGDFINLLDNYFEQYQYFGYDVLQEMVSLAKEKFHSHPHVVFKQIGDATGMQEAEYTIASGIFNLRYSATDEEWLQYITETLHQMNQKSKKGFAFNALTKYSDSEYMQPHLYYSDPLYLFDYCKRNFSKDVALLHDYQQYDFTILVRKY